MKAVDGAIEREEELVFSAHGNRFSRTNGFQNVPFSLSISLHGSWMPHAAAAADTCLLPMLMLLLLPPAQARAPTVVKCRHVPSSREEEKGTLRLPLLLLLLAIPRACTQDSGGGSKEQLLSWKNLNCAPCPRTVHCAEGGL